MCLIWRSICCDALDRGRRPPSLSTGALPPPAIHQRTLRRATFVGCTPVYYGLVMAVVAREEMLGLGAQTDGALCAADRE